MTPASDAPTISEFTGVPDELEQVKRYQTRVSRPRRTLGAPVQGGSVTVSSIPDPGGSGKTIEDSALAAQTTAAAFVALLLEFDQTWFRDPNKLDRQLEFTWLACISVLIGREMGTEVKEYFLENNFLLPLIIEAIITIRNQFSKDTEVSLQVVSDAEVEGYQNLFLTIFSKETDDSALNKLEELFSSWWLKNLYRAKNKLVIDVMCV